MAGGPIGASLNYMRRREAEGAGAGVSGPTGRRGKLYDPGDEARLDLQRRALDLETQTRRANIGLQRDTLASQERTAAAGRSADMERARMAAKAAYSTSEYGGDPEQADRIFGTGGGNGAAPARPAKKVYNPEDARQARARENRIDTEGRKRYYETHQGEAAKRGTFIVQAAPGTPELTGRFTNPETSAADVGAAAGQVRNEYQKSPVYIKGLAQAKAIKNARLQANVDAETRYQQSTGSIPQGQAGKDYATQNMAGDPINRPNMAGPEAMTPEQTAALADKQTPAGVDFYGERNVQSVIEKNMDIVRSSPPGSTRSKRAQAIANILTKARGTMADQTPEQQQEGPPDKTGYGQLTTAQLDEQEQRLLSQDPGWQGYSDLEEERAPAVQAGTEHAQIQAERNRRAAGGAPMTPPPKDGQAPDDLSDMDADIAHWQSVLDERQGGQGQQAPAESGSYRSRMREAKLAGITQTQQLAKNADSRAQLEADDARLAREDARLRLLPPSEDVAAKRQAIAHARDEGQMKLKMFGAQGDLATKQAAVTETPDEARARRAAEVRGAAATAGLAEKQGTILEQQGATTPGSQAMAKAGAESVDLAQATPGGTQSFSSARIGAQAALVQLRSALSSKNVQDRQAAAAALIPQVAAYKRKILELVSPNLADRAWAALNAAWSGPGVLGNIASLGSVPGDVAALIRYANEMQSLVNAAGALPSSGATTQPAK